MPFASREEYLRYQRRYDRARRPHRVGRPDKKLWRARRRQESPRPTVPPGVSRALDLLRDQLRRHDRPGPEHDRLAAAVAHMERVILGEKIKPRDPPKRSGGTARVPLGSAAFNIRLGGAPGGEGTNSTSRQQRTWMDDRLGD